MITVNQTATAFAKNLQGLGPSDALARIEDKLQAETNEEMLSELMVMKAQYLAGLGHRDKAIGLLRELDVTSSKTNVPYFLAEQLVQGGEYKEAMVKLTSTINRSRELNESWFLSVAHLLRSYCAARTGNLAVARLDLEQVENDEQIFWLSIRPQITKKLVQEMIDGK